MTPVYQTEARPVAPPPPANRLLAVIADLLVCMSACRRMSQRIRCPQWCRAFHAVNLWRKV